MSDINFNATDNKALTIATNYKEMLLQDIQGSTVSTSSTTFVALPGTVQGSFTTTVTGLHKILFTSVGFAAGGNAVATFRVVIDKGLGGEVIAGSGDVWQYAYILGSTDGVTFTDVITISSGLRTVDFEIKVGSNTFSRGTASGYASCCIEG